MNRSLFRVAAIWLLPATVALLSAGCARDLAFTREEVAGITLYAVEKDSADTARAAADSLASIAARLQVPVPMNSLSLYLLPSSASLRRYLREHCPEQESKAAACFTRPEGYVIALSPGAADDDVNALLRHEITHFILASRYFDFPPWIDEGLAQYFERKDPDAALPERERGPLAREAAGISAASIEGLLAVPDGGEMTRRQYREAKVLVHVIMRDGSHGPEEIKCYLHRVRSDGQPLRTLRECFRVSPAELADRVRLYFTPPGSAVPPVPGLPAG
jgi:hypothetical protein